MVRGVNANQLSLDTVGHNITNASTIGYSRQSVNLAATRAQETYSIYGTQLLGSGVDSTSILRARNIYADKQYWTENGTNSYYETKQANYDKVEAVFNDSDDNGIENAMEDFYSSWSDLSSNASTTSNRTTVIEKGKVLADRVATAAQQIQQQVGRCAPQPPQRQRQQQAQGGGQQRAQHRDGQRLPHALRHTR